MPYTLRRNKDKMIERAEQIWNENEVLRENERRLQDDVSVLLQEKHQLDSLLLQQRQEFEALQQTNDSLQKEELPRLRAIEQRSVMLVSNVKQVKDAYDAIRCELETKETDLASKRQSLEQMVDKCRQLESQIHDPHSAKTIERIFWNIMTGQEMRLSPAQLARRADLRKKIHNAAGILAHGLTDQAVQRFLQEFSLVRYSKANSWTLMSSFNVLRGTVLQIFRTEAGVLDDRDILDLTSALDGVWLYLRVWSEFLQKVCNGQSNDVNVISRNHHHQDTGLSTIVTRYFELYANIKQWHEDAPPS